MQAAEACRACESVQGGGSGPHQQAAAAGRAPRAPQKSASALGAYSVPKKGCWWHADENVHEGSSFVMNCDYFPFRPSLRYRVALDHGVFPKMVS